MRVGRPRRRDHRRVARIRRPEAQILRHRPVEQRRILRHHGDHAAHLRRIQCPDVRATNPHHAALRVVQPQQQPEDRGFAHAARPDDPHRLPSRDAETQPGMSLAAPPRIGEADILEFDLRRQHRQLRVTRDRCIALCLQQRVHRIRRRLPDHTRVQHGAQIAQRAENLRPRHQDDQQRLETHFVVVHPPRTHRDGRRGTHPRAEIGEEPRQQSQRQHPGRAVRQRPRALRQLRRKRAALPERLQRRQPLHCVQELLPERLERRRARPCRPLIRVVDQHRQRQRRERRHQHHGSRRHVLPRQHGEDHHRRADGNDQLRQIRPEERLQLLHAVQHREHHAACTFRSEPGRPQLRNPVEQTGAQPHLHLPGGALRHDGRA